MKGWKPKQQHYEIVSWARKNSVPILTTNFEETLSSQKNKKFTAYYPWGSYFSDSNINEPTNAFAIWHINGIQRYSQSIKLGLRHYMWNVSRAKRLLHENGGKLFRDKNVKNWSGCGTWLDILFNSNLVLIGLGLDTTETFLRWLLIERATYFKKYPDREGKRPANHTYPCDFVCLNVTD